MVFSSGRQRDHHGKFQYKPIMRQLTYRISSGQNLRRESSAAIPDRRSTVGHHTNSPPIDRYPLERIWRGCLILSGRRICRPLSEIAGVASTEHRTLSRVRQLVCDLSLLMETAMDTILTM